MLYIIKILHASSSSERSNNGVTPHASHGDSLNLARFLSKFDFLFTASAELAYFFPKFFLNSSKVIAESDKIINFLLDPWELIKDIQKMTRKQRIRRFLCIS